LQKYRTRDIGQWALVVPVEGDAKTMLAAARTALSMVPGFASCLPRSDHGRTRASRTPSIPLASAPHSDLMGASALAAAVLYYKDAPMPVSFEEIQEALEFVSASGLGEHQAFLCIRSGKIYWHSDLSDLDDELPEDIEDDEKYLEIPDKRELDLGKPLALDFARQVLPGDLDEVRRIFRRRGAYASFKHLLARRRVLEQWYDFEEKATARALREWCELNSIALAD